MGNSTISAKLAWPQSLGAGCCRLKVRSSALPCRPVCHLSVPGHHRWEEVQEQGRDLRRPPPQRVGDVIVHRASCIVHRAAWHRASCIVHRASWPAVTGVELGWLLRHVAAAQRRQLVWRPSLTASVCRDQLLRMLHECQETRCNKERQGACMSLRQLQPNPPLSMAAWWRAAMIHGFSGWGDDLHSRAFFPPTKNKPCPGSGRPGSCGKAMMGPRPGVPLHRQSMPAAQRPASTHS